MSLILAIDPAPKASGYVVMDKDGPRLRDVGKLPNDRLRRWMADWPLDDGTLVVEMIQGRGMPVGADVFHTLLWIGRFIEAWGEHRPHALVFRSAVKSHLCGVQRAKDSNVRQAIIDLYPATGGGKVPQIGTKKEPGPLYGVSADAWAAIGVGLTYQADPAAFGPMQ